MSKKHHAAAEHNPPADEPKDDAQHDEQAQGDASASGQGEEQGGGAILVSPETYPALIGTETELKPPGWKKLDADRELRMPAEGDVVVFWPNTHEMPNWSFPVEAEITKVWGPGCVNLRAVNGARDAVVSHVYPGSVMLWRPGMAQPSGYYCAYTDELEHQVPVITAALLREVDARPPLAGASISLDPLLLAAAKTTPDEADVQRIQEAAAARPIVRHLEHAQALPEVSFETPRLPTDPVDDFEITVFKDTDGRNMRVVLTEAGLAKAAHVTC